MEIILGLLAFLLFYFVLGLIVFAYFTKEESESNLNENSNQYPEENYDYYLQAPPWWHGDDEQNNFIPPPPSDFDYWG